MKNLKRISTRFTVSAIIVLSIFVMSCSSSKKVPDTSSERNYQELKAPDRMHVYHENHEWILMPEEEVFTKIYGIIQKGWDAGKDKEGLLNMVQLTHLEEGQAPENTDRVVFEYDDPIYWRTDPGSADTEKAMNNYIFFLNWDQPWAVICEDGDYTKKAFLPVVMVQKEEIRTILSKE